MRSRWGTRALAVVALAVVFASMGFMGVLIYAGIRQSSDDSIWNLAWAFPLGGFLGLAMVWILVKLVSPPARMREIRCENCGWRRQVGESIEFCSKCGTEY